MPTGRKTPDPAKLSSQRLADELAEQRRRLAQQVWLIKRHFDHFIEFKRAGASDDSHARRECSSTISIVAGKQ